MHLNASKNLTLLSQFLFVYIINQEVLFMFVFLWRDYLGLVIKFWGSLVAEGSALCLAEEEGSMNVYVGMGVFYKYKCLGSESTALDLLEIVPVVCSLTDSLR